MAAALSLLTTVSVAWPFRAAATFGDDAAVVGWIRSHAVSLQTPEAGHGFADMQPPHETRNIGAVYSQDKASQYFLEMVAPQFFDCLLFVEKTTAARANLWSSAPKCI